MVIVMKKEIGRRLLYGFSAVIFIVMLIVYSELTYWIKRAPQDINAAIKNNINHLEAITLAIEKYYRYHGFLPESLKNMVNDSDGRHSWIQITTDPWGNEIGYEIIKTQTNMTAKIWSYGSDNKPGGEWAAADVFRYWSPQKNGKIE